MKQNFACVADAKQAADKLSRTWKYHCLESVAIETYPHYNKAGRPTKNRRCIMVGWFGLTRGLGD